MSPSPFVRGSRTASTSTSTSTSTSMNTCNSISDRPSNSPETLTDSRNESVPPPTHQPRKPIPRKGHTKSRRGCYNCKRRRIKCNELHPGCNHCIKAGLRCEYPVNIVQAVQRPEAVSPAPREMVNLKSTPGSFNMDDMRLFHHFLIAAYPHLPVGADRIWVTVIPSFAHNYTYLIHSILALSASHLDAISSASVAEAAISHRILAFKALNDALSVPPESRCERDARMAAGLALAFQSSYLQDGLSEYLTMIRGCNLIMEGLWTAHESVFNAFHESTHLSRTRLPPLSPISNSTLHSATLSLQSLISLLPPSRVHPLKSFHALLLQITRLAPHSPTEAYVTFIRLYNLPSRWTHDEFQDFSNPGNHIAQILLAHFIAVQAVLQPILEREKEGFQGVVAPTKVLGWIEGVWRGLPGGLKASVEWARGVARDCGGGGGSWLESQ